MSGKTIAIVTSKGERFTGYLAVPESGSGPGLVMLQEIFGVNATMRAAADLYAEEGYVVLVPDLFWRFQPGIELGHDDASFQQALGYYQRFDIDQAVADIGAAIATLQKLPECTGSVGAIGFCLGGLLAYLTAARRQIAAAIGFYGGGIDKYLNEANHIRCPLVLHFGAQDHLIPAEAVEQLKAKFAPRPDVSILVYPHAGHGFYLPGRASYHKPSAQMAHSPTIGLLRRVLGPQFDLNALWDKHCEMEFTVRDAEETMKTMVAQPYVNHIPTMTGGVGFEELHRFYKNHFIPKLPKDTKLIPISRTIGVDRVVDELLFCFTHDTEIDFLLPGVPPTGKYVEIPLVAIVCFRGGKLYHEHIYWDQATALVQIGLLDPKGLPVAGHECARKLLDETLPSNTLMARWAESAPKG
ncbi:MAG: dienelactone hydrolase family protein [Gemmataceae bacterium]